MTTAYCDKCKITSAISTIKNYEFNTKNKGYTNDIDLCDPCLEETKAFFNLPTKQEEKI